MDKSLLLRYIEGDCTEEEKIKITKWLDSDPQNMKEYMALRKLHDISIWQMSDNIDSSLKLNNPVKKIKRYYIEIARIAAIFVLAFVLYHVYFSFNEKATMQTLNVPQGQRAQLTLADGTKVWLNAKSILTFPNHFKGGLREVTLDGEGYFQVAKNKKRPFIVNTNKYDVKVLGTTFNLKSYSQTDGFETSLLEGSVEILKPESTSGKIIKPNQRIYLHEGKLIVEPITHIDYFLWKDGILSFDDEPFQDLMKKLELIFDIKIEIKNEGILRYRCTGKFRTKDGVQHILNVLKLANEFNYEINSDKNTITID